MRMLAFTWAFLSVVSGFPTTALFGQELSTLCVGRGTKASVDVFVKG